MKAFTPPCANVAQLHKGKSGGSEGASFSEITPRGAVLGALYWVQYTGCNTMGAIYWVQYSGCYCSTFPLALKNVAHTTFSLNKRPFRANTVPQRKFCKICVCCQIFAKQKIPCKKKKKITLNGNYQDVIWNIGIGHCCVFRKDKSLLEVLINLE